MTTFFAKIVNKYKPLTVFGKSFPSYMFYKNNECKLISHKRKDKKLQPDHKRLIKANQYDKLLHLLFFAAFSIRGKTDTISSVFSETENVTQSSTKE